MSPDLIKAICATVAMAAAIYSVIQAIRARDYTTEADYFDFEDDD